MKNGWVKLHRKIKDNLVWTNDKALKIFINCLFRANFEDKTIFVGRKKVKLKAGQFVTSYPKFAQEVGYSQSTAYYWLELLELERMIERLPKGSYTIITVLNYDRYQGIERKVERLKKGQRKVKETEKKDKKEKKDKNKRESTPKKPNKKNRDILNSSEFVSLMQKEFPALDVKQELLKAEDWLRAKGRRYKDYTAFARNWLRKAEEFKKQRKGGGLKDARKVGS